MQNTKADPQQRIMDLQATAKILTEALDIAQSDMSGLTLEARERLIKVLTKACQYAFSDPEIYTPKRRILAKAIDAGNEIMKAKYRDPNPLNRIQEGVVNFIVRNTSPIKRPE